MQPSMFNLRVPLPERDEVFLMNTLTDAQLVVSTDVASLLDRLETDANRYTPGDLGPEEFDAFEMLRENGFIVASRQTERRDFDNYFVGVTSNTEELHITVLTTLQCNF